ncbi:MAG TPA: hypothetical protein VNJ04_15345 [Gemmatimonadaceae bacterium]|nr:hypothetical protein [Gemmatimonadaceae bacterium]
MKELAPVTAVYPQRAGHPTSRTPERIGGQDTLDMPFRVGPCRVANLAATTPHPIRRRTPEINAGLREGAPQLLQ